MISLGISNEITTSFRNTYKIGRFGTLKKLAIFTLKRHKNRNIFASKIHCKNMPSYVNVIEPTLRPDSMPITFQKIKIVVEMATPQSWNSKSDPFAAIDALDWRTIGALLASDAFSSSSDCFSWKRRKCWFVLTSKCLQPFCSRNHISAALNASYKDVVLKRPERCDATYSAVWNKAKTMATARSLSLNLPDSVG